MGVASVIVEARTLQYGANQVPGVVDRFGEALAAGADAAGLLGFWVAEVGELNRIVQFWGYASEEERHAAAERGEGLRAWVDPQGLEPQSEELTLMGPMPFSPTTSAGEHGAIYEIRTYRYGPDMKDAVAARWGEKVPARARMSPFIGAWWALTGAQSTMVHVWAYDDAAQRQAVRAEAVALGVWPPNTGTEGPLLRQRSELLIPAPFSPWR